MEDSFLGHLMMHLIRGLPTRQACVGGCPNVKTTTRRRRAVGAAQIIRNREHYESSSLQRGGWGDSNNNIGGVRPHHLTNSPPTHVGAGHQ